MKRKEKVKKAARKESAAVSAKVKHTFDAKKGLLWPVTGEVLMKYSMDVEGDSDGDPVEVLLHDVPLLFLGLCLAVIIFLLIYI